MTATPSPQSVLVLWDIDGTLLEPAGGGNADYEAAVAVVHPGVELQPVHTHGKTDRQNVEEYLSGSGLPVGDAPLVLEQLDVISHKYLLDGSRLAALPGANEALHALREAGHVNGLLTGNTPARAINKLTGAGISVGDITWQESFFGSNASTRPAVTAAARLRFPERRIVIVGDTPLDGDAAAAADLEFIAVATGVYDADSLWASGAVSVLPDLVSGAEGAGPAAGRCGRSGGRGRGRPVGTGSWGKSGSRGRFGTCFSVPNRPLDLWGRGFPDGSRSPGAPGG